MRAREAVPMLMTLVLGCGGAPAVLVAAAPPAPAPAPRPEGEDPMGSFEGPPRPSVEVPPPGPEGPAPAPSPSPAPIPTPSPPKTPPPAPSKPTGDTLVPSLLAEGGPALKAVLASPERFRFQVLYGVIKTSEKAAPTLERHGFRADAEYFFPASSMKVPLALAGCERLPSMRAAGRPSLDREASLQFYPQSGEGDPYVTTLAREVWRAIIVSDNAAANRLLAFVGHREANETLWGLKLASARLHDGFSMASADVRTASPRIGVVSTTGALEEIPARTSTLKLPPTKAPSLLVGTAAIVDGRRVAGPMSFAEKNAMSLRDLQDTLVRVVRPELLAKGAPAAHAAPADVAHLKQALGTLPSQSGIAGYDRNVVADYQLVPFLRGLERVRARDRFEIYTKVGQAYGFLTANAYVVEKATGRAFFLAATVYTNKNEVLNDDVYEYDTVAFPVLADVAEVVARHAFGP